MPTAAAAVVATIAAVVALLGCNRRREPPAPVSPASRDAAPPPAAPPDAATATTPDPAPVATGDRCTPLPFAETLPVPEASGSALLPIDGLPALVVVADSGNDGAYVIVDPETGAVRESGQLPLGAGGGDDVEGLAVRDGAIVGLTSSGFVLRWQRAAGGKRFELVDGPYPIAEPATGLSCPPRKVNCGKNYEGLCLRSGPIPDGECAGLAASKADGSLHCVMLAGDRLVATVAAVRIGAPETLTGCDLAPDGSAWAGTNLFGGSSVYRVTGWTHPDRLDRATVEEIGQLGPGFPESIAVGAVSPPASGPDSAPGVVVYRFSDLGGAPSAVAKYRCADAVR